MQEGKPKMNTPLRTILDGLEKASKEEAYDYSRGHLNHNHLYKPPKLVQKSFWQSWKSPSKADSQSRLLSQNLVDQEVQRMKDAWSDFAIKTSVVHGISRAKSSPFSSFDPKMSTFGLNTPINTPFIGSSYKKQDRKLITESRSPTPPALCIREELEPSDVKLIRFKPVKNRRISNQDLTGECTFVPLYLSGFTKRDQMDLLLQFDKQFVKTQDLRHSNDFNKNETLQNIENKMSQELMKISDISPPNFQRLQIISANFEDLCNESVIFGNLFSNIKIAYDAYLDCLLDSHPEEQYECLLRQMQSMKKRLWTSSEIVNVKEDVKKLEEEAIAALERNEELRDELENLTKYDKIFKTDMGQEVVTEAHGEKQHTDTFLEEVEEKRRQVIAIWQEVHEVEQLIKDHMVLIIDAESTEQYVQDAKVKAAELQSSIDFLEEACKSIESSIQSTLDKQHLDAGERKAVEHLMNTFLSHTSS